jgi:hypothetical protein
MVQLAGFDLYKLRILDLVDKVVVVEVELYRLNNIFLIIL